MQHKLLQRRGDLMAGIGISLSRLRKLRELFEKRLKAASATTFIRSRSRPSRLEKIANFGTNPGNLRMHVYVPVGIGPSPPLVVALHGCTQTAEAYNQGTGWSELADRFGFVVIFPEQQPANNPKNCFSWFLPGDTGRDGGEALSIRQMIAKAVETFGVDSSRIFVTGLSAGGAMACVMLATYPEVFAGGAIIAGLPYGSASSVQEAFEAMFNERAPSSRALGDHVREASRHHGPWPRISVWQGTADTVVRPSNAEHIIRQWLDVQRLPERSSGEERIGPHTRRFWTDANGDIRLEAYSIAGMTHGVPLATTGADGCGVVGPFFLEAGVSSTAHIALFWDLTCEPKSLAQRATPGRTYPAASHSAALVPIHAAADDVPPQKDDAPWVRHAADPSAVIAAAFKAAGLPAPESAGSERIDSDGIIAAALKAAGLKRV
jgi:poly(hydroxyalkanoate) depolymerase family esterase